MRFRADGVDVHAGLQIPGMNDGRSARRRTDDDVGVIDGFRSAAGRLHFNTQGMLHLGCKGGAILLVAAIDAGAVQFSNGGGRGKLGSRLRSAAEDPDDAGVRRAQMPDGEPADRTGSEVAETISENNALELRGVGRPHRDDLRMLRPVECFIDSETSKRFLAEDAADGEDEIAAIGKETWCRGGEINRLSALARKAVSRASIAIIISALPTRSSSFRIFVTAKPPADAGMLQPQPRLRSIGRASRYALSHPRET